MKHKHADLIHAWADGATIQVFRDEWWDCEFPHWNGFFEYRIKPEPKPDTIHYYSVPPLSSANTILPQSNLRLTFDGDTGKLKSAEVI
jgi:hypothetical protein